MSYITAEEFELVSFFGVEPQQLDPDVPWPYSEFSYHLELVQYIVDFTISPAYRDVSFSVSHSGAVLYSFSARSVKDVFYHKTADGETLEIVVSDRERILFRLRPTLSIVQTVDDET